MAKRLNGEGSYRERPNGTWEGRVAYLDDDDTPKRLSVYGKDQKTVAVKLRAAIKRIENGDPAVDADMTVAAWCEQWIGSTLAASSRKPTTKATFETMLRNYVEAMKIGRVSLAKLRPSHVDSWLVELRSLTKPGVDAAGQPVAVRRLSESTIRKAYNNLSVVLDGAVRDRMLARNPMEKVDAPVPETREARFLSPTETVAILNAAKAMDTARRDRGGIQSANYPLLAFIAATGVRKGEALALKWADVDMDAATVKIRGTLSRVKGELVTTAPKTAKSRRELRLSPGVVRTLRAHRTDQLELRLATGELWHDTGHVFTTVTGHPIDPSTALRMFKTAAAKAGVTDAAIHTLRHSAATAMLDGGVALPAVSAVLGHARTSITSDIYTHATDRGQVAAMDAAAAVIGL